MMQSNSINEFVSELPVVERFTQALSPEYYRPVPDDWFIALSDVVQSTKAIAAGHYKSVNMAGVSIISAIMNEIGHREMLYIFGGDGAAVAFPPDQWTAVERALSLTVGWVEDELDLQLRAAIVPVSVIRQAGWDVLAAAIYISPSMKNYAFSGGGLSYAERLMKQGEYRVERNSGTSRPNLKGLCCRWTPITEKGSKIVSLIVEATDKKGDISPEVVQRLMEFVQADKKEASPMPGSGPGFTWPPDTLKLESKATGMNLFVLFLVTLLAWFLDKTGLPLGAFDPKRYRKFTALNTDYRKIQDGIRMTVSVRSEDVAALRSMLDAFRDAGELRYGICEQDQAVLTCFVPSLTDDTHFHFLDGAGGGYSAASNNIS